MLRTERFRLGDVSVLFDVEAFMFWCCRFCPHLQLRQCLEEATFEAAP